MASFNVLAKKAPRCGAVANANRGKQRWGARSRVQPLLIELINWLVSPSFSPRFHSSPTQHNTTTWIATLSPILSKELSRRLIQLILSSPSTFPLHLYRPPSSKVTLPGTEFDLRVNTNTGSFFLSSPHPPWFSSESAPTRSCPLSLAAPRFLLQPGPVAAGFSISAP